MWIPRNIKTRTEYEAISDAEKAAYESDPMLRHKYTFRKVADVKAPAAKSVNVTIEPPKVVLQTSTAPAPVEAKRVKSDPE